MGTEKSETPILFQMMFNCRLNENLQRPAHMKRAYIYYYRNTIEYISRRKAEDGGGYLALGVLEVVATRHILQGPAEPNYNLRNPLEKRSVE